MEVPYHVLWVSKPTGTVRPGARRVVRVDVVWKHHRAWERERTAKAVKVTRKDLRTVIRGTCARHSANSKDSGIFEDYYIVSLFLLGRCGVRRGESARCSLQRAGNRQVG